MQTFLPFPDYRASCEALDPVRCRNQRRETVTLLRQLLRGMPVHEDGRPKWPAWFWHPACQMWADHIGALALYGAINCHVILERGWGDNTLPFFEYIAAKRHDTAPPPWLGDSDFHAAHRSNLVRKDPEYYGERFSETPDLEYVWPRTASSVSYREACEAFRLRNRVLPEAELVP